MKWVQTFFYSVASSSSSSLDQIDRFTYFCRLIEWKRVQLIDWLNDRFANRPFVHLSAAVDSATAPPPILSPHKSASSAAAASSAAVDAIPRAVAQPASCVCPSWAVWAPGPLAPWPLGPSRRSYCFSAALLSLSIRLNRTFVDGFPFLRLQVPNNKSGSGKNLNLSNVHPSVYH